MPLRIDTSKCEPHTERDETFMEALANIMYAVGVGQIRDENECRKLYRRYYMLRLSSNDIPSAAALFPYAMMRKYIGAHTNVSDVSDFQFNKHLVSALRESADLRLDKEMKF
jgi:hypothetical protein